MRSPRVAGRAFARANASLERAKLKREQKRAEFIASVDASVGPQDLERQVIYPDKDPEAFVRIHYPKWRILAQEETIDGWRVLIEEDPAYKTAVIIDPVEGMVYQRSVSEGSPDFDQERMRSENPTLFKRVTTPVTTYEWKEWYDLTDADREAMLHYLLPPKLTVTTPKPRKAKPEELE
jgi:hypothetical protein